MDRFDAWAKARAQGMSRRDLLRRSAVVGAAVAATPLIQSVSAPAYAVSGTCSDPVRMCGGPACGTQQCPNGGLCNTGSDCVSGYCQQEGASLVCTDPVVTCTGSDNAIRDDSCSTGYCDRTTTNCTPPPPTGALGAVCHGSTQAVANANCLPALTCTNYNTTTNEGTCG